MKKSFLSFYIFAGKLFAMSKTFTKSFITKHLHLFAIILLLLSCNKPETEMPEYSLAYEAYIYAFPAVEHNKVFQTILSRLPANQFFANTQLMTHENTAVVSPNNDTYYSQAICDIRNEPVVITVPLIENRYFSIQLCDIFTNCPDYIGTRTTGDGPGNYLLARSDWNGVIPAGIDKVIKTPATIVFALARTQVFGCYSGKS